mmetsp:Transcript_107341/g.303560  ORF Transcript_107341/g.303560 Transcript_107341/m.303560 type:complete len:480 (+) Transcript_107341:1799-3238(+)
MVVIPEGVVHVRIVDDGLVVLRVALPHCFHPHGACGPGRLHEVQENCVTVGRKETPYLWHHLLVELPQAKALLPEEPRGLVDQLNAEHHAGRRRIELVPKDQLRELDYGPLSPLVLLPLHKKVGPVRELAREALVRHLGARHRMEVEQAAHAALLQPAQQPGQVELAPVHEAVGRVIVHEPPADGHADVRHAEGLELVQLLLGDEAVPVPPHERDRPRVLGPAVSLDELVLVPEAPVQHLRGPHPVLHQQPAAHVDPHKRLGSLAEWRVAAPLEEVQLDLLWRDGSPGCTRPVQELEIEGPVHAAEHDGGEETIGPQEGCRLQAAPGPASAAVRAAGLKGGVEGPLASALHQRLYMQGPGWNERGKVCRKPGGVSLWRDVGQQLGHHGRVPGIVSASRLSGAVNEEPHDRVPDVQAFAYTAMLLYLPSRDVGDVDYRPLKGKVRQEKHVGLLLHALLGDVLGLPQPRGRPQPDYLLRLL